MRAIQYRSFGAGPELVEIDTPVPGEGEILLRITASGLCHSDQAVMALPEERYPYSMPQTLGHEPAGVVAEVGPGVTGVESGTSVIVYGAWGCGMCEMCADGSEQLCLNDHRWCGLGHPGAMAEYMIVKSPRHLVPIGDLDPVRAASLTDAALTPYHAIKSVLPKLAAGSTAVVIGAGGLGHVAIQLLRTLTAARVVALDLGEDKLAFAREVGAHEAFQSDRDAAKSIRRLTGGRGANVVFDFVGNDATGKVAVSCAGVAASVVLLGAGGGGPRVGFASVPRDLSVSTSTWGRRSELFELVELARRGQIEIHTQDFDLAGRRSRGIPAARRGPDPRSSGHRAPLSRPFTGCLHEPVRCAAPNRHTNCASRPVYGSRSCAPLTRWTVPNDARGRPPATDPLTRAWPEPTRIDRHGDLGVEPAGSHPSYGNYA
ncbi:MAG TPA: NAD(P)-dependent alcohol dehydrogenase [Nakamurella sp.]